MEVNIDLNTAKGLVSIIDACTRRGAFGGDDLEPVATIRKVLLTAMQPALQAEQGEQGSEPLQGEMANKVIQ